MIRRQKLVLILLTTVTLSPLYAFNFGARFNLGLSSGAGTEWTEVLEDAGSHDYNEAVPTAGLGVFAEFNMSPELLFAPELYYVINRGTALADDHDNYIKTVAIHSMELLLPVAHDFDFDSGKKAFRIMGGFQFLYSFNLEQEIKINDTEQTTSDLENKTPFSMGFVLGSGLELGKLKKMSWLLDMRMILPVTSRMRYTQSNGSNKDFKTVEFLVGSGIKF